MDMKRLQLAREQVARNSALPGQLRGYAWAVLLEAAAVSMMGFAIAKTWEGALGMMGYVFIGMGGAKGICSIGVLLRQNWARIGFVICAGASVVLYLLPLALFLAAGIINILLIIVFLMNIGMVLYFRNKDIAPIFVRTSS